MPLHTFNNALVTVLTYVMVLFWLPYENVLAEQQSGAVLPPMTVFGIRNSDNTFSQKSEVAWHDDNDPTIVRQTDGSYTAKSTTNPFNLTSLLASLGQPTLNIDLAYAPNSASMTAEGNLMLNTLLESFKYLSEDSSLQLTPTIAGSEQSSRRIMQRRLEVLSKTLAMNAQVDIKLLPAKVVAIKAPKLGGFETWRIQIRRVD